MALLDDYPHLLLFEVTDRLDGKFAFDGGGGVTGFQLDDGPGSFVQACNRSLIIIQLLLLFLFETSEGPDENESNNYLI